MLDFAQKPRSKSVNLTEILPDMIQYFAHKSKNLEKIIATEKPHVSQRKRRSCEPSGSLSGQT